MKIHLLNARFITAAGGFSVSFSASSTPNPASFYVLDLLPQDLNIATAGELELILKLELPSNAQLAGGNPELGKPVCSWSLPDKASARNPPKPGLLGKLLRRSTQADSVSFPCAHYLCVYLPEDPTQAVIFYISAHPQTLFTYQAAEDQLVVRTQYTATPANKLQLVGASLAGFQGVPLPLGTATEEVLRLLRFSGPANTWPARLGSDVQRVRDLHLPFGHWLLELPSDSLAQLPTLLAELPPDSQYSLSILPAEQKNANPTTALQDLAPPSHVRVMRSRVNAQPTLLADWQVAGSAATLATASCWQLGGGIPLKDEAKLRDWVQAIWLQSLLFQPGAPPFCASGFTLLPKSDQLHLDEAHKYSLLIANLLQPGPLVVADPLSHLLAGAQQALAALFPRPQFRQFRLLRFRPLMELEVETHGGLTYLLIFNPLSQAITYNLGSGLWFDASMLDWLPSGTALTLPPGDTRLMLANAPSPWRIMGSTGHLFPGAEVTHLALEGEQLHLHIHPDAMRDTVVYVSTPNSSAGMLVNGMFVRSRALPFGTGLAIDTRNCPRTRSE